MVDISWDVDYEDTKVISGVGTAFITVRSDDWNRSDTFVSLDSKTYHVESIFINHKFDEIEYFYAVPNGKTLHPILDIPHIKFNEFSEVLCNKFTIAELEQFIKWLNGKRAKFCHPANSEIVLYRLITEFYSFYDMLDRSVCLSDLRTALSIYGFYKFNFSKYKDIVDIAKERQESIKYQVLKSSFFIA